MRRRTRIKDIVADKLAEVEQAGATANRLAVKAETVLDAIIDAGEIVIRPRFRDESEPPGILRTFVESVELAIPLDNDAPEQ